MEDNQELSMSMFANKEDFLKAREDQKQRVMELTADPEVKQSFSARLAEVERNDERNSQPYSTLSPTSCN